MNLSQNERTFNHKLIQINRGKMIFYQRKACAVQSMANGVTGKKCTAFFTARGVNNPYWMRLGENQRRSVT